MSPPPFQIRRTAPDADDRPAPRRRALRSEFHGDPLSRDELYAVRELLRSVYLLDHHINDDWVLRVNRAVVASERTAAIAAFVRGWLPWLLTIVTALFGALAWSRPALLAWLGHTP